MQIFAVMSADKVEAKYQVEGHYWPTVILKGWIQDELGRPVELDEFRVRGGYPTPEQTHLTHNESKYWGVIYNV